MPRVDVWDIQAPPVSTEQEPLWVGFTRAKLSDRYDVGKQLGQGGFGSVQVVVDRSSGKEYACKSVAKRLAVPNASSSKQNQHLENIKREALIVWRLRGTLNVVHLEDVFEDEEAVHMVMEWCKGGELVHRINTRHYSERTAASYMRAVLRTLAQCHHLRILHRDIKPGNFMLLTDADNAPVKAIDFGLAVFFDPKKLPRKDLGLEGTPHFMAPEQLSGQTWPASDIWSAGIMAYQLLCGFVPFDDVKNPRAPALSLVWRAILSEEPKFTHRAWEGISDQAKDFVRSLLAKDHTKRPTAKQALMHPWLQGKSAERNQGAPLRRTVVQRLQKFGVESALKRTVLDMIANELINRHLEAMTQQRQDQQQQQQEEGGRQQQLDGEKGEDGERHKDQQHPEQQQQGHGEQQRPQETHHQPFQRQASLPLASPAGKSETAPSGASIVSSPVAAPPAGGSPLAADTAGGRLRQLAAQDLLLRTAPKHATVHAGGEALAALRRGQLLGTQTTSLPRPPSVVGIASPAMSGASIAAAAAAALQQQFLQKHSRRSHDLGHRPGASPTAPGIASVPALGGLGEGGLRRDAVVGNADAGQRGGEGNVLQPQVSQPPQRQSPGADGVWLASAGAAAGNSAGHPTPSSQVVPGGAQEQQMAGRGNLSAMPPRQPAGDAATVDTAAAVRAAASAGSLSASGSETYKGPVRDPAAAKAWDMGFMAHRLAHEGSGHALQHYAWLLNMGERSLHSVLERSHHSAVATTPAPGALGRLPPVPASPSSPAQAVLTGLAGSPQLKPSHVSGGAAAAGGGGGGSGAGGSFSTPVPPRRSQTTALSSLSPGTGSTAVGGSSPPGAGVAGAEAGGSADYLRMLSMVARQRAEHRKYQRLSLDTSGHRQTHYTKLMRAQTSGQEELAEEEEEEEEEEGEEADERSDDGSDGAADGTGRLGAMTSAATTGAFSMPVPSGTSSAMLTATSLPPPSPSPSQRQLPPSSQAPAPATAAAAPASAASAASAAASSPLLPVQRSPMAAPPPATPAAAAGSSSPAPPRLLKPSIPGLEEADAVNDAAAAVAAVAAAAAAPASAAGPPSAGRVSYNSSLQGGDDPQDTAATLLADVNEEAEAEAADEAGTSAGCAQAADGDSGRRSLLKKVRKALMKPVKSFLATVPHSGPGQGDGRRSSRTSAAGTGTTTPVVPLSSVPAGGSGTLATVSVASVANASTVEEGGRGQGAYAAFVQYRGTGNNTPQERSVHGGTERSVHGGRERSGHGNPAAAAAAAAVPGGGDTNNHRAGGVSGAQESLVDGLAASLSPSPPQQQQQQPQPQQQQNQQLSAAPVDMPASPQPPATAALPAGVPGPAGYAIHTVRAHREVAAAAAAAADAADAAGAAAASPAAAPGTPAATAIGAAARFTGGQSSGGSPQPEPQASLANRQAEPGDADASGIASEEGLPSGAVAAVAAVAAGAGAGMGAEATAAGEAGAVQNAPEGSGGLAAAELIPTLGLLLGDPAKAAELQEVMRRLQYDKAEELTAEQLSEGLQWLGYRLEPSEVQDLLRQVSVGANDGLTATQFIASQVDWRTFQANHRDEWLGCLRRAFEDLGGAPGPDGQAQITVDQLVAALHEKLPEEEVNLAVQESLMDAAVEADAVDFDAFVKLMRCNSNDSLGSAASSDFSHPSLDLYDPRLKDASLHGPLGEGGHYHPALETVPDDQE